MQRIQATCGLPRGNRLKDGRLRRLTCVAPSRRFDLSDLSVAEDDSSPFFRKTQLMPIDLALASGISVIWGFVIFAIFLLVLPFSQVLLSMVKGLFNYDIAVSIATSGLSNGLKAFGGLYSRPSNLAAFGSWLDVAEWMGPTYFCVSIFSRWTYFFYPVPLLLIPSDTYFLWTHRCIDLQFIGCFIRASSVVETFALELRFLFILLRVRSMLRLFRVDLPDHSSTPMHLLVHLTLMTVSGDYQPLGLVPWPLLSRGGKVDQQDSSCYQHITAISMQLWPVFSFWDLWMKTEHSSTFWPEFRRQLESTNKREEHELGAKDSLGTS